jgi:hypothetical protein
VIKFITVHASIANVDRFDKTKINIYFIKEYKEPVGDFHWNCEIFFQDGTGMCTKETVEQIDSLIEAVNTAHLH